MKFGKNAVKAASYTAGILLIASALMLAVLLFMSALGFIHPRREHIAIRTETYTKIFDAEPISGGVPVLTYGSLHEGHTLITVSEAVHTKVGVYRNEPKFIIIDTLGADVTDMYDITADYGEIIIEGRPITVCGDSKEKIYDGTPLVSDALYLLQTEYELFEGHSFVCTGETTITDPGEVPIASSYRIINEFGANVTDQYSITELIGTLTVHKITIKVRTSSYSKYYDGLPLSEGGMAYSGAKLPDHYIMPYYDEYTEPGNYKNEPDVKIFDANGNDVSGYYNILGNYGTLTIMEIPINITTQSAEKIYDGEALTCTEWSITSGTLHEGDSISASFPTSIEGVGIIDNYMEFKITDANGNDVSDRYSIGVKYGTLRITPRPITIRTGSASKVYDGKALICEEYEISSGSLVEGEILDLSFTSIINIGYSENYVVALNITKTEKDGTEKDVSSCYTVTFDCGMLTVTAN